MNTEKQNNFILKSIQDLINLCPEEVKEQLSDGFHDFKTLYDIRLAYNVALFNEWGKIKPRVDDLNNGNINVVFEYNNPKSKLDYVLYNVHKSWKHNDGEWCFGKEKEWFIVCAMLPTGQISNHYPAVYWDLFKIPITEKALFEFDGHTTKDCIERLKNL